MKGKIHPAGIRDSPGAELRQSHHRKRKAGEREAVAFRLLAVFGSCLGSERGRFASLSSLIHYVHRYLVFWILKPHISCKAFRLALKMREFIQILYFYLAYMIYVIIYEDRLCFQRFFSSVGQILHFEKIL